jgi:hypothetical protein
MLRDSPNLLHATSPPEGVSEADAENRREQDGLAQTTWFAIYHSSNTCIVPGLAEALQILCAQSNLVYEVGNPHPQCLGM